MSSLSDRLTRAAATSPSLVDHVRRLVADWQLLADLSFADLTLWVPLESGVWWCVAQVRPLTAPTSQPDDLVGSELGGADAEPFAVAHREGRPVTEGEPDWSGAAPRRREVIPVRHDGAWSPCSPGTPTSRSPARRRRWSSPTSTSPRTSA